MLRLIYGIVILLFISGCEEFLEERKRAVLRDLTLVFDQYQVPYEWQEVDTLGLSFDLSVLGIEDLNNLIIDAEAVLVRHGIDMSLDHLAEVPSHDARMNRYCETAWYFFWHDDECTFSSYVCTDCYQPFDCRHAYYGRSC